MKVWKHLKSLSDKDVLSFKSYTLKISELLAKLNKSVLQAFSGNINLSAALQSEGLPSIASYQNWIDNIFTEEDEPRLIEILNNPELVSAERISKITDSSQKNRLQKKAHPFHAHAPCLQQQTRGQKELRTWSQSH